MRIARITIAGLLSGLAMITQGQVVINEFKAANSTRALSWSDTGVAHVGTLPTWYDPAFEFDAWSTGQSPFHFQGGSPGTDLRNAMRDKHSGLYLHKKIILDAAATGATNTLFLSVDYDDGFLIYLNGKEAKRVNLYGPGLHIYHDMEAMNRRSGVGAETYALGSVTNWFVEGTNTISIQAHNISVADRSFRFMPELILSNVVEQTSIVSENANWDYFVGTYEPAGGLVDPVLIATGADNDFLDWVELVNTSTVPVNLAGWRLTDDPDEPSKWTFPSLTLAAGEHRVIFCSGADLQLGARLHTNFQLSRNGEYLALVHPLGHAVSFFDDYPAQSYFHSYGRTTNGTMRYFDTASPGAANHGNTFDRLIARPEILPDPGAYTNDVLVTISNETAGLDHYYTLDGSEPNPVSSLAYAGPFLVNSTQVVRARSFGSGAIPSSTRTAEYLIRQPELFRSTPSLFVTGDPATSLDAPHGIFAKSGGDWSFGELGKWFPQSTDDYHLPIKRGRTMERPVQIRMIGEADNFAFACGIRVGSSDSNRPRLRGDSQSDWIHDWHVQHGMNLLLRNSYGKSELDHALYPDDWPVEQHDRFRINLPKRTYHHYLARDEMLRRICRDVGFPSVQGRFCHLYLNGAYKGYSGIIEKYTEDFLNQYYGYTRSWDIVRTGGGGIVEAGTRDDFADLLAYMKVADCADPAVYAIAESRIDMAQFVDYLLVHMHAFTGDWVNNNWSAVRERDGDGRWRFVPWDADISYVGTHVERDPIQDLLLASPFPIGVFFQCLINSPEFRLLCADRIQKQFFDAGPLTDAHLLSRFDDIYQEVHPITVVNNPSSASVGTDDYTSLNRPLPNFGASFIQLRRAFLFPHFQTHGLWPDTTAPILPDASVVLPQGHPLNITHANAQGTIYYSLDGSDPRASGGGVQGQAWTNNLPLTENLLLTARVLDGTNWSPVVRSFFTVEPPHIAISEIMYHSLDDGIQSDEDFDFIELVNLGSSDAQQGGLRLDGAVRYDVPPGILGPGEVIVITEDPTAFTSRYQNAASPYYWEPLQILGPWQGRLGNDGETLRLYDGTNLLSEVAYRGHSPWPRRADGFGSSLVFTAPQTLPNEPLARLAATSDPGNWSASALFLGSPGTITNPAPEGLSIHEVHTDPTAWAELHRSSPVSLATYALTDNPLGAPEQKPLAGQLFTNDFLQLSLDAPPLMLDPDGGRLYLVHTGMNDRVFLADAVAYGSAEDGPYGQVGPSQDFTRLVVASPGSSNSYPRVGPLVIRSIMYASSNQPEYIEILNVSHETMQINQPGITNGIWRVTDGVSIEFPALQLAPGASCYLTSASEPIFRLSYPQVSLATPVFGPWSGSLDASGERIRLSKSGSDISDELSYLPHAPWPLRTTNQAIIRVPAYGYGNDPMNWRLAAPAGTDVPPTRHLHMRTGHPAQLGSGLISGQRYELQETENLIDPNWSTIMEFEATDSDLEYPGPEMATVDFIDCVGWFPNPNIARVARLRGILI